MIWSWSKWNGHNQNELVRSKLWFSTKMNHIWAWPIHFGCDHFILSRPNHYGHSQINLIRPKPFWTDQNCFGHIEGQGIKGYFFILWGGKGWFLLQSSDGGGTFCLLFWNLHKEVVEQSMVIFSIDIGQRCTIAWYPMFLEHWNRQKILSSIRQHFSCQLDEEIAKICKKMFTMAFWDNPHYPFRDAHGQAG